MKTPTPDEVKDRVAVRHGFTDWNHLYRCTHLPALSGKLYEYENEAMQEYALAYHKSFNPSEHDWSFIANNHLPHEEGRYLVEDKFGRRGMCLYANSGAPSENISFFSGLCDADDKIINSKDIIKWKKI